MDKQTQTVWIGECLLGSTPKLEQYQATRVEHASVTVLVRGKPKVIRRSKYSGLACFTDQSLAIRWLANQLDHQQKCAAAESERLAALLARLAESPDEVVSVIPHVPYRPGTREPGMFSDSPDNTE